MPIENIRVHWMPRQCFSTRYKNIKEREKKYNPGTFLQLSENVQFLSFFFFLYGTEDFQKRGNVKL